MTAPTTRLLACAATAAVTIGLLTGCTGGTAPADPTPAPTPSSTDASPSATPTASATAAAPEWTTAMDQVSVDGALAVGQYFLELYPYVHATGDTTAWRALSHPECLFCADVAQDAENPPEGGYVGTSVAVQPVRGTEIEPATAYSLDYAMVFTSDTAAGSENEDVLMVLVRDSDRWLVRAVQVTATDAGA